MKTALDELAGKIIAEDMRAKNEGTDGEYRDPAEVVWAFRVTKWL